MDRAGATGWLRRLKEDPEKMVVGMGVWGDPGGVPWVVGQMEVEGVARVAGEAFELITGVDLEAEGLVAAGEDGEGVPDAGAVRAWWERNGGGFRAGERYLAGKPIRESWLREVLVGGTQPQRRAAALELALLRPDAGLFNCRARGRVQERMLREKAAF
jgi:uncharacterized protein (TIGR02270 family)